MGIITISRPLGAGETTIAPALAKRLGWRLIDHEFLDREAKQAQVSVPHSEHWDEHDPTLAERLRRQGPEFEAFLSASRQVMQDLAGEGDVVIVGRGGNLLLRDNPSTLHVRFIADMPYRIRRVMEIRWLAEEPARELIAKSDRDKASFYRHVFGVDWSDPMLYDLVIRTDRAGLEPTIDLLAGYFERPDSDTVKANTPAK